MVSAERVNLPMARLESMEPTASNEARTVVMEGTVVTVVKVLGAAMVAVVPQGGAAMAAGEAMDQTPIEKKG
jgi:malonyl CoA-acyl carrier protein transacylase